MEVKEADHELVEAGEYMGPDLEICQKIPLMRGASAESSLRCWRDLV